jgi:hypothetical protein
MRNALVALMVLALASIALAGQNPYIATFLVDNATGVGSNYVCPSPNGTFNVYVCFDRFGTDGGGGGGMLGCSFAFVRTFGGFKLSFQNLLGGLMIGDPEVAPGCALTSGANPVYPDANGIVVAAAVQYLYTGTPGTIVMAPHGTDGRAVADANNDLDFWCIRSIVAAGSAGNFGCCMDAPDGDCEPISPVEESSWGSIKALYR